MTTAAAYDVVIVGGGSGGCTLAARLTEDPACRVLLLERGPDPRPLPEVIALSRNILRVFTESPYVQTYPTARSADGSIFYPLAGRLLGGGSSVNFMAAHRPAAADFDPWLEACGPLWAWERVLPVLKRMEHDADFGETEIHGGSGPLWVMRAGKLSDYTGWERAFIDACIALGYPASEDLNVPNPYGVVPWPRTVRDGLRQSAAVAYIEPARGRGNLTILDQATVLGVEFAGDRAVGVRYVRDGVEARAAAGEVVLAAGVYHSPQLLMLSGIGPREELGRHGIAVRVAVPGVGENLQDHAAVFMTFDWRGPDNVVWPGMGEVLLAKSDERRKGIDLHVMLRGPIVIPEVKTLGILAVYLLEQRNRGRLTLAGTDPLALPVIEPRVLDDPEDVAAITAGMQIARRLARTPPLSAYYGELVAPATDEEWGDYARRTYDSYHHGAGTCKMGRSTDPMAVVDEHLRVRGVRSLRVADASVMPVVVRGNTNLTTIMIAERCADFLHEGR